MNPSSNSLQTLTGAKLKTSCSSSAIRVKCGCNNWLITEQLLIDTYHSLQANLDKLAVFLFPFNSLSSLAHISSSLGFLVAFIFPLSPLSPYPSLYPSLCPPLYPLATSDIGQRQPLVLARTWLSSTIASSSSPTSGIPSSLLTIRESVSPPCSMKSCLTICQMNRMPIYWTVSVTPWRPIL